MTVMNKNPELVRVVESAGCHRAVIVSVVDEAAGRGRRLT